MKNKKIILIRHILVRESFVPPFGLMLLADSLLKAGFCVKIFDAQPSARFTEEVLLESNDCLFTGFSTNTCPTLLADIELSKKLKQRGVTIVWGGAHATFNPQETIKEPFVDYVLMGEAEERIQELAFHIKEERACSQIPGLAWKDNSEIKINPGWQPLSGINNYRFRWDLINVSKYFRSIGQSKRALAYIISRGCPYRCGFCHNSLNPVKKVRYYDEERIIEEINFIKREYNIDGIIFNDDCLFAEEERTFRIIERIGLAWVGEIRADRCTEAFLSKAKETNCFELMMGAESGDNNTLKSIHKDITTQDIIDAVHNMRKMGIKARVTLVMFFPYETVQQMIKTAMLAYILIKKYGVRVGPVKTFNAYRGTYLYNISLSLGWKPPTTTLEWSKYAREMDSVPYPFFDKRTIEIGKKLKVTVKALRKFHYLDGDVGKYKQRMIKQKIFRIVFAPFLYLSEKLWFRNKIMLPFEYYLYTFYDNLKSLRFKLSY